MFDYKRGVTITGVTITGADYKVVTVGNTNFVTISGV